MKHPRSSRFCSQCGKGLNAYRGTLYALRVETGSSQRGKIESDRIFYHSPCGRSKKPQTKDIDTAKERWSEYKREKPKLAMDYKAFLAEKLRDPQMAAGYLSAALEEGEDVFLLAIRDVAEAFGE